MAQDAQMRKALGACTRVMAKEASSGDAAEEWMP
eukprot:CAMPEP_0204575972 /NCGR_PEP_ID=MMETSP0661-20131031/41497_1 /ASSEMBLY_ACC=CAM_ASM_000606 /TAXON_ID=109239 /ORGANISM="Alexandrium margalefi, Strain AMGDE01CS-322" /LENGTH=33 /DNA_ID= /DNA_START= /DNA_END= /DNA_ORIENTATION=